MNAPAGPAPIQPNGKACGWCKTVLVPGVEPYTHEICPKCDREFREKSGLSKPTTDGEGRADSS